VGLSIIIYNESSNKSLPGMTINKGNRYYFNAVRLLLRRDFWQCQSARLDLAKQGGS